MRKRRQESGARRTNTFETFESPTELSPPFGGPSLSFFRSFVTYRMPQVGGRHIPLLSAFVPMNNIHVQPLPQLQLLPQRPPQPAPPRVIDRAAEIQHQQQQQQFKKEQRRAARQAIINKWEPRLAEERQRCESWIPTVLKSHPTADHCLGVQIERFWQVRSIPSSLVRGSEW